MERGSACSAGPPARSCGDARWWWRSCGEVEAPPDRLIMLRDTFLPPSLAESREQPHFRTVERPVRYLLARWTPENLEKLVAALREGTAALREIPAEDLLA